MKNIKTNLMEVEQLMKLYENYNFLYPAKREKLLPVFSHIKENLKKAFTLPDFIYRTLTCYDPQQEQFTSIAAWKYSGAAMIIQHLVSNNPVKTREIFLYHILKLAGLSEEGGIQAILTYYQPKTKFVHTMFTYLLEHGVNNGVLIEPFSYYQYRFEQPDRAISKSKTEASEEISISPLQEEDYPAFRNLLLQERGELYLNTMDLKPESLTLADLNEQFQQAGLFRSRVVLIAKSVESRKIRAILLINRGSVGLHFSLIENSSELILDSFYQGSAATRIASQLLEAARSYYLDCPLDHMPLLVKSSQSSLVESQSALFQRQYNLLICDRANFFNWVNYLFQAYEKSLHYQPVSTPGSEEEKPAWQTQGVAMQAV
jgi:hypothetical protein